MKYNITRLNSLQWQSCLHWKILFQKDYSLGIHFSPCLDKKATYWLSNKMHLFSNNLTCTALINKAHRCMKPTDLISNVCREPCISKYVWDVPVVDWVSDFFFFQQESPSWCSLSTKSVESWHFIVCLHCTTKPHQLKLSCLKRGGSINECDF